MRRLILASLFLIAACGPQYVDRPVIVKVPVATPCPPAEIRSAGEGPELALQYINPVTSIDKDVAYWKATVLQLQSFVLGLKTERADLKAALEVCQNER